MTQQPNWKLVAQLGDADPIEYGGYFVYQDETGVYAPEAEYLERLDEREEWTVYRFSLDECTYFNGVLSENKFHPDHPAWFAKPESERATRPQDNTYLSNIADSIGMTVPDLIDWFCSDDVKELAQAYRAVGEYHGFENLDSYPLTFTSRAEVEARYAEQTAA